MNSTTLRLRSATLGQAGTWAGVLGAELLRTKSSAIQWFPIIGLLIGIFSSTFSLWSSGAHDASGVLSWQAMYITGMAAPILALLAGLAEAREKKARSGGTDLRPVSPVKVKASRLAVLVVVSAIFHLLNFGVAWLFAVIDARAGANTILFAGALSWIGSLATIALFSVIARATGLIPALLIAVIYQAAGTLNAEADWWWVFPPAWPVRLLLPTLGIHSNAVPLESGHPLADEHPAIGIVLNLVFALAMATLAIVSSSTQVVRAKRPNRAAGKPNQGVMDDTSPTGKTFGGLSHHPYHRESRGAIARSHGRYPAVLAAMHRPLARTAVIPFAIAAVILLYLVALIYPSNYVSGLYTFALLPLGAGLTPLLTWPAVSGAWPTAVIENHRIRSAFLSWQTFLLTSLAVLAAGAYLLAEGGGTEAIRLLMLWMLTGILLVTIATGLCVRFGPGITAAATVLWTVISATLGGDILAETVLWLVAVPSWPETAYTAGRFAIAVAAQILLIAASMYWSLREIRAFERRG